ncbi:unnamed protein product, partial [Durusdinium trenchii]
NSLSIVLLTAFEKDESDLLASLDQSLVSTILLKAGAELVKDFMQEAPDCRNDADQEDPVSLLFALASLESKNAFNTSLLRSKKDAQVAINVQNQLISMLIEKCLRQKDSAEIGPMDLLKRALAETACSVKSLQDVRFEKESMNNVQDDCWSMVLACDITFLRCGLQALEAEKDQQEKSTPLGKQLTKALNVVAEEAVSHTDTLSKLKGFLPFVKEHENWLPSSVDPPPCHTDTVQRLYKLCSVDGARVREVCRTMDTWRMLEKELHSGGPVPGADEIEPIVTFCREVGDKLIKFSSEICVMIQLSIKSVLKTGEKDFNETHRELMVNLKEVMLLYVW